MQWKGFAAGALTVGLVGGFLSWILWPGDRVGGARPPIIIKGGSLSFHIPLKQTGGYTYFLSDPNAKPLDILLYSLNSNLPTDVHKHVSGIGLKLKCKNQAYTSVDFSVEIGSGFQVKTGTFPLKPKGSNKWVFECSAQGDPPQVFEIVQVTLDGKEIHQGDESALQFEIYERP